MPRLIPPAPGPDDQYFWDGVREHKLLLQRCSDCGLLRQPPSPMCQGCHSLSWDTQPASGRGTVHCWIVSHHPTEPDAVPRIVALIDLEEGVRFVANLSGIEAERVRNEMSVELCFAEIDGVTLPQFAPAREESS
ncbi:MAG: OB-fold domain-containing protein [Proteobacteria bacterium]|nr:OB-fold domain-containing protein [Pseudomonadota bacterium]